MSLGQHCLSKIIEPNSMRIESNLIHQMALVPGLSGSISRAGCSHYPEWIRSEDRASMLEMARPESLRRFAMLFGQTLSRTMD